MSALTPTITVCLESLYMCRPKHPAVYFLVLTVTAGAAVMLLGTFDDEEQPHEQVVIPPSPSLPAAPAHVLIPLLPSPPSPAHRPSRACTPPLPLRTLTLTATPTLTLALALALTLALTLTPTLTPTLTLTLTLTLT